MHRGLKADLRFLNGDHGFFQTDFGVFHLNFILKPGGIVLRRTDRAQGAFESARKSAFGTAGHLTWRKARRQAGAHRGGHGGGGKSEFHIGQSSLVNFGLTDAKAGGRKTLI